MKYSKIFFISLVSYLVLFFGVVSWCHARAVKIFWVDSYHQGYAWSDGIEQGIHEIFKDRDVVFEAFHMDTKKCKTTDCMNAAARQAKKAIDAFKPDVLIASDDNAQKYLILPFYKDSSLPVVFCGVNWDASGYGYPTQTITGMIEVDLVHETIGHMRRFAKGDRIGYISGDTASDRKIINWLNRHFFNMKMEAIRVKNYTQFEKSFLDLQSRVDMLFIRNFAGIEGWNELTAKKFIAKHLKIPTGTNNDFMAPYVIFTLGKIPQEQGEYAARTALEIAAGARASDFPVVTNKRARLTVNLDMARSAGVVLPLSIIKIATVIGQQVYNEKEPGRELLKKKFPGKRVCWVDSYHKGYEWSDGIEMAIKNIFFETGIEFKIFRMDTKRQKKPDQIKSNARRIKSQINAFDPDLLIASDDNAQQHLVVPFYKDTKLPVIFCGVNWDAVSYGYPAKNVTGMVEVLPFKELISFIRPYARGDRIGYLAGDAVTERKLFHIYNTILFKNQIKNYLVSDMAEFKKSFLAAQDEVDILFFSNSAAIEKWDFKEAERFVRQNTRIPSVAHNSFMERLVMCTMAHSSEEQGRYAALTALRILQGENPESIPLSANKEISMVVNLSLAKQVGIVFPLSIIKQARVIGR